MTRPILLALTTLLVSGCQGLEPITLKKGGSDTGADTGTSGSVIVGDLEIAPAEVSFGVVGLAETATQTVVLSNLGEDDLIVRQASIDGDSQFNVSAATGLPVFTIRSFVSWFQSSLAPDRFPLP